MFKNIDNYWKDKFNDLFTIFNTGSIKTKPGVISGTGNQVVQENIVLTSINHNYGIFFNNAKHRLTLLPGGSITSNEEGNAAVLALDGVTPNAGLALQTKTVFRQQFDSSYVIKSGVVFNGSALSIQLFGVSNSTSAAAFGTLGGGFGIVTTLGGVQGVIRIKVTVGATGGTATIVLNDVVNVVPLTASGGNVNFTAYEIGKFDYGQYLTDVVGDTVYFISTSPAALPGAFTYTSATSTAVLTVVKTGTGVTFNFVPVSLFSEGKSFVSSIDPTLYNFYAVAWGSGQYVFSIRNPSTGYLEEVHKIEQSNLDGDFLATPSFQGVHSVFNFEGFADVASLETLGCTVSLVNGNIAYRKPTRSLLKTVTLTGGVETIVSNLYTRSSFNDLPNEAEIQLKELSVSCDGVKPVSWKIVLNPTTLGLGTTANFPRYSFIDEDLTPLVSGVGSALTYAGGTTLFIFSTGKVESRRVDLEDLNIFIQLEDIVLITALSSNTSEITLTVTVVEDF